SPRWRCAANPLFACVTGGELNPGFLAMAFARSENERGYLRSPAEQGTGRRAHLTKISFVATMRSAAAAGSHLAICRCSGDGALTQGAPRRCAGATDLVGSGQEGARGVASGRVAGHAEHSGGSEGRRGGGRAEAAQPPNKTTATDKPSDMPRSKCLRTSRLS